MRGAHSLTLHVGDRAEILQDSPDGSLYSIKTAQGIGRLSITPVPGRGEITVGFTGATDHEWIHRPSAGVFSIEALTKLNLDITPINSCINSSDLITKWLWDLHLVRHPVGAMSRLKALLQLMVVRFGYRTRDGYVLPFQLSHFRFAEVIGVTRSTATRLLNLLRQQGQISINILDGSWLLSPTMMDQAQRWRFEAPIDG